MNIRFTAEQLKKLGNFKEIPEMLEIDRKVLSLSRKRQVFIVALKNSEISAVKHFIEKLSLLYLVYLSKIFCRRLYGKIIQGNSMYYIIY